MYVKPFRDWVIYRCDLKTDFKYVIWFSFGNPLKDVWKKISPVVVPTVGLYGLWEAEIYQADIKFKNSFGDHIALLKKECPTPLTNADVLEQAKQYQNKCIDEKLIHKLCTKGQISWSISKE